MGDYGNIVERAVRSVFAAAQSWVVHGTYVQPKGFRKATGSTTGAEVRVEIAVMLVDLHPRELDLVNTQPGDERMLVLASDLGNVSPVVGDYFVAANGARHDIVTVGEDPTKHLWELGARRSLDEDLGEVGGSFVTEDLGGLGAATDAVDAGGISPLVIKPPVAQRQTLDFTLITLRNLSVLAAALGMDGKAAAAHTHVISQVRDLDLSQFATRGTVNDVLARMGRAVDDILTGEDGSVLVNDAGAVCTC